jgi:hypothetical protein
MAASTSVSSSMQDQAWPQPRANDQAVFFSILY